MFLHWTTGPTSSSQRAYQVNSFTSQSAAEVLTTQAKFGTHSANVRGAGYVQYFAIPDYTIGSDDFAIEFFYYLVETPPDLIPILTQAESLTADTGGGLTFWSPTNSSWTLIQNSTGDFIVNGLGTNKNLGSITTGSWHHIAVSRTSGTLETYLDGTRITTNSYSNSITGNRSVWFIGFSRAVPNDSDPGYFIDGFRYTIGSNAGYTGSTITTPTTMPPQVLSQTRLRLDFEGTFDDIP